MCASSYGSAALDFERLSQALGERIDARLAYGLGAHSVHAKRPLWVRARDVRAQRSLFAVGAGAVELGTWTPVALDAPQLADLIAAAGALDVQAAPRHHAFGRKSLRAISGTEVHAPKHNRAGYLGRGVLVGLVDTGIEPYHPAFLDDANQTRVVSIWDQDFDTTARQAHHLLRADGFDYGAVCDATMLREGRCPLGDPIGHGTHVAGIAAGDAHLVGGLAPRASIAVVRSQSFERIADATLFLERLAAARNELLVINISVGGHYGPHDGQSPLEQYLWRRRAKGHVVVAAAGNEGDRPLHVTLRKNDAAKLRMGSQNTVNLPNEVRMALERAPVMPLHQPHPDATALLELWGQTLIAQRAAIELWHHKRCIARYPIDANGERQSLIFNGVRLTNVRARRERPSSWGNNTKRQRRYVGLSIAIDPVDDALEDNELTLVVALEMQDAVRGRADDPSRLDATIEGWLSAVDGTSAPLIFAAPAGFGVGWARGDSRHTISIPATGRAVISVASSTVQRHWQDSYGFERTVSHESLGALSTFSSLGPVLWGGPIKPEITAPGSVVASARASSVPEGPDTLGPITMVMQGTSMAAPHVSGTVALLFEAAGPLGIDDVRQILTQSARAPSSSFSAPDEGFGYGHLDADAAIRLAQQRSSGCTSTAPPGPVLPLGVIVWRSIRRPRRRQF